MGELIHTLRRLRELAPPPPVVVVDNGLSDGTAQTVRTQFHEATVLTLRRGTMSPPDRSRPRRTREDYQRGLPGYHDPTAGIDGSTPARSALTLRAVLAGFGLVFYTVAAVLMIRSGLTALGVVLAVLAAVALVDLGWVIYRKRRGEPG